MKSKKRLFLTLIIIPAIFASCEDAQIENIDSEASIKLSGVAHFSSQQELDNSINLFIDEEVLPLKMQGVSTLSKSLELKSANQNLDVEQEEDSLICSDILREFLNSNYEIAIGNVFFKVTDKGTFFTTIDNYKLLWELATENMDIANFEPVSYALGYSFENNLFKLLNYEFVYFFDTFRKLDAIEEDPINIDILKSSSQPNDSDWKDISDSKTIVGKAWSSIWGFSKSVRVNFDSKHRVDVKFYAQRFPFYSEMGIKTKTQYKGWTGIWRKQDCNEIINGWEILNLKEKWPNNFFGSGFNLNTTNLATFTYANREIKHLAYNQSLFLNKTWKTFNVMGLELDFSYKDMVGALWNASKSAGKSTVTYLNGRFKNPSQNLEAIRLIPASQTVTTTKISLAPYSASKTNTDKYTTIIATSNGGTITATFNSDSGFGYKGYTNLTANYTFLENSILFGAARRGDTWKGVRITFK